MLYHTDPRALPSEIPDQGWQNSISPSVKWAFVLDGLLVLSLHTTFPEPAIFQMHYLLDPT